MEHPTKWAVTLLPWEAYLRFMTIRDAESWNMLQNLTDLIVGGLDFECDFLYIIQSYTHHLFLT